VCAGKDARDFFDGIGVGRKREKEGGKKERMEMNRLSETILN